MTLAKLRRLLMLLGACAGLTVVWAGGDRPTEFTNMGSIVNTRHNMTFRSTSGVDLLAGGVNGVLGSGWMADINPYGEVCVFCHTPHGADTDAPAPLWNRKLPTTTVYTTYDKLNTTSLTQTVTQPGAASLACLSCHDGQQAIDAIRNMPGSGKYQATPDNTFLNTWYGDTGEWNYHLSLSTGHMSTTGEAGCLSCHAPTGPVRAGDFTLGFISTDLRDDHPIGVHFPSANGDGTDFKAPTGSRAGALFFDENGNSRLDKQEIRLYDSGDGPQVECASCHDPHGVPSAGNGSKFFPTFLRKANGFSALCLTCHTK
jgi:hypothetical protein